MHLQITIYNLQIIFADLKKMGETYAICIYNLQFTNYFCRLKKSWVIHLQYAFTIYNLQIIFAEPKQILMILRHLQFTIYKTKK